MWPWAKGDLSVHTAPCSSEVPLYPGGPGSPRGQPGIGVCVAVLPGAHELGRGKGPWGGFGIGPQSFRAGWRGSSASWWAASLPLPFLLWECLSF